MHGECCPGEDPPIPTTTSTPTPPSLPSSPPDLHPLLTPPGPYLCTSQCVKQALSRHPVLRAVGVQCPRGWHSDWFPRWDRAGGWLAPTSGAQRLTHVVDLAGALQVLRGIRALAELEEGRAERERPAGHLRPVSPAPEPLWVLDASPPPMGTRAAPCWPGSVRAVPPSSGPRRTFPGLAPRTQRTTLHKVPPDGAPGVGACLRRLGVWGPCQLTAHFLSTSARGSARPQVRDWPAETPQCYSD